MRTRHTWVLRAFSPLVVTATALVSLTGLSTARAAGTARRIPHTLACGGGCFGLYSRQLGPGITMNAFIPGDTGSGGKIGRKINMVKASDYRPNSDFIPAVVGRVFQFCGTGKQDFFSSSSYVCTNDANYWVFQAQWSPLGAESDLCLGVGAVAQAGEAATLRTCGVSASTLWITDNAHSFGGDCRVPGSFCPWMSGSAPNFQTPLVLTVNSATRFPVNQLQLDPESLLGDGHAIDSQEFAFFWGSVR